MALLNYMLLKKKCIKKKGKSYSPNMDYPVLVSFLI